MIISGHIEESLFVADLGNTIQGTAPKEYSNPHLFFQGTILTRGIIHLLNLVQVKMHTGEGSGIIKLETPFGGGKTHGLISIYHYAANGVDLHNDLPKDLIPFKSKVVTIVGTNLNPLEGRDEHDICIYTIWGDIAYQIAGVKGYKEFEANDINRISPGKDKLVNFLQQHQPFLLLFDEIAEYIAKARGISVNESNLGAQTLIFIQELSEAITSLPRGLLVITLPVHEYEDFSETKLDIINRINRILGRVETSETPIERKDIYKLITKRLIRKVLLQEVRDDIISNYIEIYQNKRLELPEKIQNPILLSKMKDSYPFHPELIDLLYDRWCSLPSFQGIRAILKILTRTLKYLYASKEKIDLILPSNINLNESILKNEFLKHVDAHFTSILNSDVNKIDSSAISNEKSLIWNELALGITQTIFLSSFAQAKIPIGLTLSELKLILIRPHTHFSLISEILFHLQTTLHYLHFRDGRYFFSLEPNLNWKIQDLKDSFQEEYEEEMRTEIKKHVGKDFKTIIWPSSSTEIPDDHKIKIVIIHPSVKKNSLWDWLERKGTTFRQNKNTILFVLAQKSHYIGLQDSIRTKLALNELYRKISKKNHRDHAINLEIKQRQDKINEILPYQVRKTYSILYDGTRTISLGLPSVGYEPLTKWFHHELLKRELIVSKLHYRKLKELFLSSNPCISTQQIVEQFSMDPNLFKIESAETVQNSICWGIKKGAFGRAIINENRLQTKSFFFSVELDPSQIIFATNEFLLCNEVANKIKMQIAKNSEIIEVIIPEKFEKTPFSGEITFKTLSESQNEPQEFHSLILEVEDLDSKSLPAFYRGVLVPLESKKAEISVKIKLNIRSEKEIPETIIETTLKETIRQLGGQITGINEEE